MVGDKRDKRKGDNKRCESGRQKEMKVEERKRGERVGEKKRREKKELKRDERVGEKKRDRKDGNR